MVVGSVPLGPQDGASPKHVVTQLLLDAGADVDAVDAKQQSVLHHVVLNGDAACSQLLLARGDDPNATDIAGRTPILTALISSSTATDVVEILTLLLHAGADPFRCDDAMVSLVELLDGSATARAFVQANPVLLRGMGGRSDAGGQGLDLTCCCTVL